jgi:predicted DNA-binding ribbon-helix-helix protein
MSRMIPRSLPIAGIKTSLRLEEPFWIGLQEIADKRSMALSDLIGTIDAQRQGGNRSSALRVFVLEYYRSQVTDASGKRGVKVSIPPPLPTSRRARRGSCS